MYDHQMENNFLKEIRPYLAVILMQFGTAGGTIIAKSALNHGMSHFTFSVYRNTIATSIVSPFAFLIERKIRPRMTLSILYKIALLALLEPVLDQNLYYSGLKYTTATFTTAMCNIVPAITFLLAWGFRLERVNVRRIECQAKILGTLVTFGGAMIMTVVRGSLIHLPWTKTMEITNHNTAVDNQNSMKGALMVTAGCFCWSLFYILQAITLKEYPAALSLTGMICLGGALQGSMVTLVAERHHPSVWSIGWNTNLVAYAYSGLIGSGVIYYVGGVVIKGKGPVFVTSFNPLSMVIVAILSSFIFADQLHVGKVMGAVVIVLGLYLVIWGKAKDHYNQELTKDNIGTDLDKLESKSKSKSNADLHATINENEECAVATMDASKKTSLSPNDIV